MTVERVANVVTLVVVILVFVAKGLAYLIPWRGIDRLRLALALVAFTWTVIFSVTFGELLGWIGVPPPAWYPWVTRVALIVFGTIAVIELIRAGAFRRPKEPSEIP